MKKLLDTRYVEHVQVAKSVERLCYPIARSIEVRQPATALKLLQAAYTAYSEIDALTHPFRLKKPERKIERSRTAAKCVRAVLKRLSKDEPNERARLSAAVELTDRFLTMLDTPVS